jgi:NAD+ synthase (glutamine-hydrolysing)
MRVGMAQINTRVGDFAGNAARIRDAVDAARMGNADVVVFAELTITGYPPRDLLFDRRFVATASETAERLARDLEGGPPVVVGLPIPGSFGTPGHPSLNNVAAVLAGGTIACVSPKRLLPSYDVFNESRWFFAGDRSATVDLERRVGLLVCEDMWDEGYPVHPSAELRAEGAELLVCLSASPYRPGTFDARLLHARRHRAPLVFMNAVGANDELVFDGQSFAIDGNGDLLAVLPAFEEAVVVVDVDSSKHVESPRTPVAVELFAALTLGVRDFVRKNGTRHAVLGLSGGVDSALVACIAREALGRDNVTAVAIPSRFTDPRSTEYARELASNLGIRFDVVDLEPVHSAAERSLTHLLDVPRGEATAENLQARLRMAILAAYTNSRGGVLLNTSNKSELSLGYGTLYGDMAGTLSVLGDLTKPQVYAVAHSYDRGRGVIPLFILERPPSAELRPDQVDPFDYPTIAPVVESLVRGEPPIEDVELDEVARFRRSIRLAEHKRWQSGIILKVSEKSFGTGRMMPVTHAWQG